MSTHPTAASAHTPKPLPFLGDAGPTVHVVSDAHSIGATIVDPRADVRDAFSGLDPSRRNALAYDGWTLGLRAVMSAHRLAEESRLADIGGSLVREIERRFEEHVTRQQTTLGEALRGYFDPRDGQVTKRLEGFLKDGGDLSRTLATYLSPEHGALAKTLARELGESSPLLRRLSPTDAGGVVAMIERTLQSTLQQNQASLAHALDPLAPDGAVARLMAELRREMGKAGDLVVRCSNESAYEGCALVIEAKRVQGYPVSRALAELAEARSNRSATAGLFVLARSHAPAGFDGFRRFGEDILVVWDPQDRSTDAYLHAALLLGLALAARGKRAGDQGAIDALADVEGRIAKEIGRHERMRKQTEDIRAAADKLEAELEKGDTQLGQLLKKAKATLRALNVELADFDEERRNPVALLPGSLRRGRLALEAGGPSAETLDVGARSCS